MRKITLGRIRKHQDALMFPDTGSPALLWCGHCGAEYSATPGDYFMLPDSHVFMCCDEPMRLVFKRTRYEEAK